MVEPSSPVLSPASPTNSTSSSSSSQSSDSSSSSSAGSVSSRSSGGSVVAPILTPKVEPVTNGVVNNSDDVIELSSDSEGEQAPRSVSPVSCSSSEPPEDDLEMIEELKEIQRQFQLKLEKLEKRVNKRRRVKQQRLAGQQEPTSTSVPVQNGQSVPQASTSTRWKPLQPFVEGKKGLKRKLEIVTEELSRSRMEQAKKLRKNAPKEQMVIDIPDFPMEYYDISANYALYHEGTDNWFDHFNNNPEVIKFGNYYNWITERTNNLLPEVIKIMRNTEKRNVPASNQLKNKDLLSCRQVCKTWKHCLDKYLQGQVSYQGDPPDSWNGEIKSVSTKISTEKLETFAQLVKSCRIAYLPGEKPNSPAHPFPSRQLMIEVYPIDNAETSQNFKIRMSLFLAWFGHEVSYLSLVFTRYQESSRWFFSFPDGLEINWYTLRSWLLKMPNLRGVSFQFSPTTVVKSKESITQDSITLASQPFPTLPKLEFIECHFVPSVLVNNMLSNNSQIKQLSNFENCNENALRWPWSDCQLNLLENLTHLSLNISKMTQVQTLQTVYLPLRKLHLSSIGSMMEKWNLEEVFVVLRNFGNTLKQLRLKLRINIPDKDLKLTLPNLEDLDLCFQQNFADIISYDFILPLSSLQFLKVNFNWEEEVTGDSNGNELIHDIDSNNAGEVDEKMEVIQLKSYQNRLYFSNIWNLFPCLKRVIIEDREREESPIRTYKYCRDRLPK